MKAFKKPILTIFLTMIALAGCQKIDWTNFYLLTEPVKGDYRALQTATGWSPMPSTGDVKMLVVPVSFYDGPTWDANMLDIIQDSFFGASEDTSWESLSSFYYKSSFGKLNISGELTAPFASDHTVNYVEGKERFYGTQDLYDNIATPLLSQMSDEELREYDSDQDGFIDAVAFIYSNRDGADADREDSLFWAWVSWFDETVANVERPAIKNHTWMSIEFFKTYGANGRDAHTIIHESGHLLGLEDLYDYDYSGAAPAGAIDMMDNNITDHNVVHKWALGWNTPYIVTGDAEITLKPSQENGEFILIPSSADEWNGSVMDEYIAIEFYTPTGLNKKDSDSRYPGGAYRGYTENGLKIYHADYRAARYSSASGRWYGLESPYEKGDAERLGGNFSLANSNTGSRGYFDQKYNLLQLMEPSGRSTLTSNKPGIGDRNIWTATDNPKTAVKENVFFPTMDNDNFVRGEIFNNGKDYNYKVTILSVTDTEAKVRIQKITR